MSGICRDCESESTVSAPADLEDLATGTPFGLKNTDDFALLSWQMDFESWQAQLPETWPYSYRLDVPQARPILDLLSIGLMVNRKVHMTC